MDSYTSMKSKLEPLGLYVLDGSTEVNCELKAYAEGLDAVFASLDEIEREFFIPTAESYGISRREKFEGREHPDLPLNERREELMYLERTITGDSTHKGFEEFMTKIGISDYTMDINYRSLLINITIADAKTAGEKSLIQKLITAEVPAHMSLNITFSE